MFKAFPGSISLNNMKQKSVLSLLSKALNGTKIFNGLKDHLLYITIYSVAVPVTRKMWQSTLMPESNLGKGKQLRGRPICFDYPPPKYKIPNH